MEILFIILLVIFYFSFTTKISSLEARINELQNVLSRVQKVGLDLGIQINHEVLPEVGETATPLKPEEKRVDAVEQNLDVEESEIVASEPDAIQRFFTWLSTDWLVKLGGFIVLLGVVFFLSLAYNNVGDIGKVSIGFAVSALIMGIGIWRSAKQVENGLIIYILGSAIATYVAYTSVYYYSLLDYNFGMLLTVMISFLATFVALKFKSESTALLSNFLLFGTPLIFSSGEGNLVLLFTYLFFVSLATVWVMIYSGWRSLGIISILAIVFYSVTGLMFAGEESTLLSVTLICFSTIALYLLVNLYDSARSEKVEWGNILITTISSLLILFWTAYGIGEGYEAITLISWSVFCLAIISILARKKNVAELLYVYGGAATVYLFVAMTYLLEGNALVLSFIFIGLLSSLLMHFVLRDYAHTISSYIALVPGFVLSLSVAGSSSWRLWTDGVESFPMSDFSVIFIESLILLGIGIYYYVSFKEEKDNQILLFPSFVGLVYLSYLLNLIFSFDYRFVLMLSVLYVFISLCARLFNQYFEKVIDYIISFNFIPVIFSFFLLFGYGKIENIFAVLLVILISSVFAVTQIKLRNNETANYILGLSGVLASYWLWVMLHFAIESEGLASLIAVSIYAVVGYYILFAGYKKGSEQVVQLGKMILGLVALRVLFIDAWVYGVEFGVFICVVVGAVLIATTFIVKDYVK